MKPPRLLDEFNACAFNTEFASSDAYALKGKVPFLES